MNNERRCAPRLHPLNLMQLSFDCQGEVIARIHNISTQGVAFEYDGTSCSKPAKEIMIGIAIDRQSPLKLNDVRCSLVYDISTLAHDQTFRGVNMRLCGLKFAGLNHTQTNKLERLLASAKPSP